MKSIVNLLTWLNENWSFITTILVLVIAIYFKAKSFYDTYKKMTEAEKEKQFQIAVAKAKLALDEFILGFVADAEINWQDEGSKLGPIKRAEVIQRIYEQYPVFNDVVDQKEIIKFIDTLIDNALITVRETIRKGE